MSKILISLVTHSSYVDVCENFIELFKKNWKYDHEKFDFIVSVIGEQKTFKNCEVYYHGREKTLPSAIYDICVRGEYQYCISFLGDAFINSKIDDYMIFEIIETMQKFEIDYCCLIPKMAWMGITKKINNYMRLISNRDSYSVSFVAFIATRKFILSEFKNGISDLDFEVKYLKKALDKYELYPDKAMLCNNLFGILPGIEAGKWNRHALKKMKKNNPEIKFTKREKLSIRSQFKSDICHMLQTFLTRKQIVFLKKNLGIDFFTQN